MKVYHTSLLLQSYQNLVIYYILLAFFHFFGMIVDCNRKVCYPAKDACKK